MAVFNDLPDDPLVTVHEARNEFEARTVAAVLEAAGVPASVFVLANFGLPTPLSPGATGIAVQVHSSRLHAARAALEANRELGASVDWDSVDVGEAEAEQPWPLMAGRFARLAARVLPALGVVALGLLLLLAAGLAAVVLLRP